VKGWGQGVPFHRSVSEGISETPHNSANFLMAKGRRGRSGKAACGWTVIRDALADLLRCGEKWRNYPFRSLAMVGGLA
jgi:hypothetical protein